MRRLMIAAALMLPLAVPAGAALNTGAVAPDFTADGALAGKPFKVNLKAALKKGPVVLYFFPSAFTQGCNVEAKAFADSMDKFKAAGATVIGMTAGKTDQLKQFSSEHCADKFAVAAADAKLIAAYDVRLKKADGTATGISDRTSYVIAPSGKIIHSHTEMAPLNHIKLSLEAVQKYKASRKKG